MAGRPYIIFRILCHEILLSFIGWLFSINDLASAQLPE